ncbi:hypothetical protein CHH28_13460 [Bacterioplanes sanyensis]|uniref:DNA-binding response regulator n=1 Tax=Bacterioplanes sanyensis TaxID=1249553 RepID=A0A222FLZ2_9GAMM|nr:response regulator transcription factor [Bacterioplanes sanyensis]ASP39616.1 hypothetical protein CHH28_13460 [Bacterioplanes sanyensis]
MRLVLADDHELFLDGLESLVNSLVPKVEVHRAQCLDSLMSLPLAQMHAGIIDLKMPGMKGGISINRIANALQGRLMILTSSESQVEQEACFQYGAQAFVSKGESRENLIIALTKFLHSNPVRAGIPPHPATSPAFTFRQQQILQAVADGLTNKQIGCQFNISENTVKKHLSHLFMILDASTRSECVAKARQMKLL